MKKLLSLTLVLLLVLAFAGCGKSKTENNTSKTSSVTSSETSSKSDTSEVSSNNTSSQASIGMIKKGLWEVLKDGKRTGYYYFSEDGKNCKYKDVELKSGVPIVYEIKDNGYIFHMGALDDNTPVSLKEGYTEGAESLTLVFSDHEEQIKYIKDCTIEEYTEK